MDQNSKTNRQFFKTVKKHDRPSAGEHNKITRALSGLTGQPNVVRKTFSKVRLIKTNEVAGRFLYGETEATLNREISFRNLGSSQFEDSDRPAVSNFCDPFDLVYDDDEYLLAFYSEQSAKFYPLNPRTVRHAITCRDANNFYPNPGSHPDTYPIKWVKLVYAEAAGRQGHALSYLNPDSASEDDYVHNIVDPDLEDTFIPEGTLVECYNVTRQWFTAFCCGEENASSSSASESSYISSSQSSSSSSSESSSNSSSGSSSASSSLSSSSSSSNSSSNSSSSDSSLSGQSGSSASSASSKSASSGGSSASSDMSSQGSSASSSGYTCVTVVSGQTPPTLDVGPPCVITWCTVEICFPAGLGITVGDEVC